MDDGLATVPLEGDFTVPFMLSFLMPSGFVLLTAVLFLLVEVVTLLTDAPEVLVAETLCLLLETAVLFLLTLLDAPTPPRVDTLLVNTLSEPVYALGVYLYLSDDTTWM